MFAQFFSIINQYTGDIKNSPFVAATPTDYRRALYTQTLIVCTVYV